MQKQLNHPLPELLVRNQGLAVFAEALLGKECELRNDKNSIVFVFRTTQTIQQLQAEYKGSFAHRLHERHITLSREKKRLLRI